MMIAAIAFFNIGCSAPTSEQSRTTDIPVVDVIEKPDLHFTGLILGIEKDLGSDFIWDDLFSNQDFLKIYENSSLYSDSAINFLSYVEYNEVQKKICINSMQRMPVSNYVKFCKQAKLLFDSNRISESLLEWVVSPNFSTNFNLIKNFDNRGVIIYLSDIRDDKKISDEFKKRVGQILAGKTWENIKEISGK